MVYKEVTQRVSSTDQTNSMDDSVGDGDQETTDSVYVTEDEDHASTTGYDDEGKCSEDLSRNAKENAVEKIKCLEATNSTGENGDECRISVQDDKSASSEDLPRRDKGKERATIEEQEDSRLENTQNTINCSFCTEPIRESLVHVIHHIEVPETIEQGPVCSRCLRGLQTTHNFQPYSAPMALTADSSQVPHLLPTTSSSTLCSDYPTTPLHSNPQKRQRVCESLSSRSERWHPRRGRQRERLREGTYGKYIEKIGWISRTLNTLDQGVMGRSGRTLRSEQGSEGRIGTRALELSNNKLRMKVSYTGQKRKIRSLKMLLKKARARLVRIRGQRAIISVPHHTQALEPFLTPLTPSSPSLPHSQSPPSSAQYSRNFISESEARRPSTSPSRPIYMGPPPSEAGPSDLSRVARPDTRSQVYFVPQSPARAARPNNPFFRSPETYPSQTIWRNDEDENMHE